MTAWPERVPRAVESASKRRPIVGGESCGLAVGCLHDAAGRIVGESSAVALGRRHARRSPIRFTNSFNSVHGRGLEPLRLSAVEPKSTASANSATRARLLVPFQYLFNFWDHLVQWEHISER
jgi:hypothetical protein